jgi:hypothetical protein
VHASPSFVVIPGLRAAQNPESVIPDKPIPGSSPIRPAMTRNDKFDISFLAMR